MNESVSKQVKKFLPEVVHLSLQCFSYLFYFCARIAPIQTLVSGFFCVCVCVCHFICWLNYVFNSVVL